jgi:hypothetical protein
MHALFRLRQSSAPCCSAGGAAKDIGNIVRRMLLQWSSKDLLFRMYQYSMLFVKHNRLQFPQFEQISAHELHHMLNVVQNLTIWIQEGVRSGRRAANFCDSSRA